ncbi:MAG TPA: hypothetical protein VGJ69_06240 [Pyrinomonadaceae bacterium]|jgi:shikimate kinase
MQDVFWLGRSRTGKSLVCEVIANRFGLDVYHVDEIFEVARDNSIRFVIRL